MTSSGGFCPSVDTDSSAGCREGEGEPAVNIVIVRVSVLNVSAEQARQQRGVAYFIGSVI